MLHPIEEMMDHLREYVAKIRDSELQAHVIQRLRERSARLMERNSHGEEGACLYATLNRLQAMEKVLPLHPTLPPDHLYAEIILHSLNCPDGVISESQDA